MSEKDGTAKTEFCVQDRAGEKRGDMFINRLCRHIKPFEKIVKNYIGV